MKSRKPHTILLSSRIWVILIAIVFTLFIPQIVTAEMGVCDDCHTMHNSQGNLPMRYDNGSTPLAQLLRDSCFGCHAKGGANAIETVGTSRIPQVYHNDTMLDLAGGNFGYIDALKASTGGASETKGHNIVGLGSIAADATLPYPPGGITQTNHFGGGNRQVLSTELTCAGDPANNGLGGCHGNRSWTGPPTGITGAHHQNQAGQIDPAIPTDSRSGYWYRFLVGVKGYEDTDWQYTSDESDHNEYFGRTSPQGLSCSLALNCHGNGGVRPPNGTMSEFCATCHGNFHTISLGTADDNLGNPIGTGTGSTPWLRHPADYAMPAGGEFDSYNTYSLSAPVARTGGVPAGSSSSVSSGSDAVMCLSCHVAHGSEYPDMLRFDYTLMDVGGSSASGTGCFACHTSKD